MTKMEKLTTTALTVVAAIGGFDAANGTANVGIIVGGFFDAKNKKYQILQYKLIDYPDFVFNVGEKNMLKVCDASLSKHLWIMMGLCEMFPTARSFKLIGTTDSTAVRMMKSIGDYKKNPEKAIRGIISDKAVTAGEVRETFRKFMTDYYGKGDKTFFFSSKAKETRIKLTWWTDKEMEREDEGRKNEYVAMVQKVSENKKDKKDTLIKLEDGKVVDSAITMYAKDIKYAFGGGGAICGTFKVNNGLVFNGWVPDGMSEEEAKKIKYLYIPPCIQVIDGELMSQHGHTMATRDDSDIRWVSVYDFLNSRGENNQIPANNPAMQTVYTVQLVLTKQPGKQFMCNKPENGAFDFAEDDMTFEDMQKLFQKNLKNSGLFK